MTRPGHFDRYHRARKTHTCTWCKNEIRPGQRYLVVVELPTTHYQRDYDGSLMDSVETEFRASKVCARCEARHQADAYGWDYEDEQEVQLERYLEKQGHQL